MLRRILVGLDGSPLAETILQTVRALAARLGSEIVLLHVTHVPEMVRAMDPGPNLGGGGGTAKGGAARRMRATSNSRCSSSERRSSQSRSTSSPPTPPDTRGWRRIASVYA